MQNNYHKLLNAQIKLILHSTFVVNKANYNLKISLLNNNFGPTQQLIKIEMYGMLTNKSNVILKI